MPHKNTKTSRKWMPIESMSQGLRFRMLLEISLAFLIVGVLLLIGFNMTINHTAERIGTTFARMQVMANKAIVHDPVVREIELARQLAASPLLQNWASNEEDERLRTLALAELESFRKRFLDSNWFYVVDESLHYYFNDAENQYTGRELAYTLDPNKSSDAWYFSTRDQIQDYALNVSPSEHLGLVKVWINVMVRDEEGHIIGMAGTGIDLSDFIRRFITHTNFGIENILLDNEYFIQAHPNEELIDFNAITLQSNTQVGLDRLLDPSGLQHIQTILSKLSQEEDAVEVIFEKVEGKRRLIGMAYLPELKWYTLAVVDLNKVIDRKVFIPLLILAVASVFFVTLLIGWSINRLILRRLVPLAKSAKLLEKGDYEVALTPDRNDEIGSLISAFTVMVDAVRDTKEGLEQKVEERTKSLELQKSALDYKNRKLEETLVHVKRLEGILSVCASCKRIRIRSDKKDIPDKWIPLEEYVQNETAVQFSHGICKECKEKLYPELES